MSDNKEFKTVTLSNPIKRGDKGKAIESVDVRKPMGGDLRGLSLLQIAQSDVDSLSQLLPRVTSPVVHKHDIAQMEAADLMEFGLAVSGFFMKQDKPSQDTQSEPTPTE